MFIGTEPAARNIRTAREVTITTVPGYHQVKAAVADCLAATDNAPVNWKTPALGLAFKPDIDDRVKARDGNAELIAQWHSGETLAVEPNIHERRRTIGLCTWRS